MDPAQTALVLVIVVLSILLVVLGIQVFFILRELRHTVFKLNKVLDNTNSITENVAGPVSSVSSIFEGIKTGASLINLLKRNKKTKHKYSERETDGE